MPLNAVSTSDTYTDACTEVFAYGRSSFSAQVSNAAVFYQLGVVPQGGRGIQWEGGEHQTVPALLSFRDPASEGFAQGTTFAAVRFRSAASGTPAKVTVA